MEVKHGVDIDASPDTVFDIVSDLKGFGRWVDTLEAVEVLSGQAPEVGTRFTQVFREDDKKKSVDGEVLESTRPQRFRIRISGAGMVADVDYQLQPREGNGTRLEQVSSVELQGWTAKLLKGVIRKKSYQQVQRFHDNLKRLAEQTSREAT